MSDRVRDALAACELALRWVEESGEVIDRDQRIERGLSLARAALAAPERPDPTHRCKVCGALWIKPPTPLGGWSLWSKKAGPCCDNVEMGEQIELISNFHRLCDPGVMGEPPAAPEERAEVPREVRETHGAVSTHSDEDVARILAQAAGLKVTQEPGLTEIIRLIRANARREALEHAARWVDQRLGENQGDRIRGLDPQGREDDRG